MVIVTNTAIPAAWHSAGINGTAIRARSLREILRHLRSCDLLVIDGIYLTERLCLLFWLLPFLRRPLVAVDLVLREPANWRELIHCRIHQLLLRRVNYFLHYFKDLRGYARCFGITAARSGYIAFKANLNAEAVGEPSADGDYVLCFGQSMRDWETFFRAMERLPYPAAIPRPRFEMLKEHASRFTRALEELPKNVQLLNDDRSTASTIRILKGAKLVVLPILKSSLCASGIGVYLNSMLLGKCVIISNTPGAGDVLTDQALLLPPEDTEALVQAIDRAWNDDPLRQRTAAAGHAYVSQLGGVPELCGRILNGAVEWYQQRNTSSAH